MPHPDVAADRRLILLRHAKSSWDMAEQDDFERPLNGRGQRAARLLAAHFAKLEPPDLVLCSSAVRARQTLDLVRSGLGRAPRIDFEDSLYLAASPALLARIAAIPDAIASLLIVGHNPGLHELAAGLAKLGPAALRTRLLAKYPTGAVATFRFSGAWREIAHASVVLAAYVTPADLSSGDLDDP